MSTIQNLKNFIRHGKQARAADPPRDLPTTNISAVHAQPQKYHHGVSDPIGTHTRHVQHDVHHQAGQYSVGAGAGDNRNLVAQTGGAAANAAGKNQKVNQSDIEAIVAEERDKASKMPKYAGLERYILVEKMGDGAFSNVYRARDTHTGDEVAIKVVRKFEMNSNQVCLEPWMLPCLRSFASYPYTLPDTFLAPLPSPRLSCIHLVHSTLRRPLFQRSYKTNLF